MGKAIGGSIFLDGERETTQSIRNINNAFKTFKSEMTMVASSFDKSDRSMSSYTAKNNVALKALGELNKKLNAQKEALTGATEAYGATDNRTLKYQKDVNDTQTEINKLTKEIDHNNKAIGNLENGLDASGKEMKDLDNATDDLSSSMRGAKGSSEELNSGLGNMNVSLGSTVKSLLTTFGVIEAGRKVFGMLKDSVSGAMDRLDTMDQFHRVMKEMTGSQKTAKKALDEVRESVVGTAYGLDVAAKATQDFVTRNMDVGKATYVVKAWADAVAFYGKGTNEQLQTVTDAIAKMRTKGTVEMDQLNRLFDVGIDAVGMYAKVMNRSSAEVQDDLSKKKISAEDFLTTVENAMMEGTNGVKKIAGAAKEAGASFSGSIDNMRAATTRGMAGFITSVDEGMKSANMGSLKENITAFGKTTEKVLTDLGKEVPKVIKKINDLKPAIIGVGAAFVAFKTASSMKGTYDGFKKVFDLVKGEKKTVSNLSTAFNMVGKEGGAASGILTKLGGAMGSLPLIGVALGVGAVVAGLMMLKDAVGETHNSTNNLKKSFEAIENAKVTALGASTAENTSATALKSTLNTMIDDNGKIIAGYEERAAYIANELSQATGIAIDLANLEGDAWKELSNNIDVALAKERAQEIIKAEREAVEKSQEHFEESVTNRKATYDTMIIAQKAYEKEKKELGIASDAEAEKYAADHSESVLASVWGTYKGQKSAYENANETYQAYLNQKLQLQTNEERMATGQLEEIKKINNSELIEIDENGELKIKSIKESYEAQKKTVETYEDAIKDAKTQKEKDLLIAQKKIEEEKLTSLEISLQDQENIEKQSLNDRIWTVLGKVPEFTATYESLGKAGIQGLKNTNPDVYEAALEHAQQAINGAGDKQGAYGAVAELYGEEFAMNLAAKNGDSYEAGATNSAMALTGLWNNFTSTQASSAGTATSQIFGDGLLDPFVTSHVQIAANAVSKIATDELGSEENKGKTKKTGYWHTFGFGDGLLDTEATGHVKQSAQMVAGFAIEFFKKPGEVRSPSRVTRRIGGFYGEGFALGISDETNRVKKASEALASVALNPLTGIDVHSAFNTGLTIDVNRSLQMSLPQNVGGSQQISKSTQQDQSQGNLERLANMIVSKIGKTMDGAQVIVDKREIGKLVMEVIK